MATVILKATDIDVTIGWYEAAGFTVAGRAGDNGREWCSLIRSTVEIQFVAGETPWSGPPAMTGSLYVPVADAAVAVAELRSPVAAQWGVEERPWGAREVVLCDPDGYFVTLTQSAIQL